MSRDHTPNSRLPLIAVAFAILTPMANIRRRDSIYRTETPFARTKELVSLRLSKNAHAMKAAPLLTPAATSTPASRLPSFDTSPQVRQCVIICPTRQDFCMTKG